MYYSVFKEFVLPPGSLWLLIATGFVLICFKRRTAGLALLGLGVAAFYLLSTPLVASRLGAMVQTVPFLPDDAAVRSSAQVIVVLSGGMTFDSREYSGPTVDETTLVRLRYAARLHRITRLPILVSGGRPRDFSATLADVMKQSLVQDFGIADAMIEDRSLDTFQNARFSAEVLAPSGIKTIILVTHASHMPRAVRAFEATGLQVLPAPTAFTQTALEFPARYIPRLSGLRESHYAIYELIGRLWYALRHG